MTRKREKAEGRGDVTPIGETAEKSSNELEFCTADVNSQKSSNETHANAYVASTKISRNACGAIATKSHEVPAFHSQRLRAAAVAGVHTRVSFFITDFWIQNFVMITKALEVRGG